MAQTVTIEHAGTQAKIRHPLGIIGLGIITFGIYTLFWWYYINREMADLGRVYRNPNLGENPVMSLLAFFPGGFLIIPPIVSFYRGGKRIQLAQDTVGMTQHMNGWIAVVLYILVSPAAMAYFQDQLNTVWRTPGVTRAEGGDFQPAYGEFNPAVQHDPQAAEPREAPEPRSAPDPPPDTQQPQ